MMESDSCDINYFTHLTCVSVRRSAVMFQRTASMVSSQTRSGDTCPTSSSSLMVLVLSSVCVYQNHHMLVSEGITRRKDNPVRRKSKEKSKKA